jgi:hypothetical protein
MFRNSSSMNESWYHTSLNLLFQKRLLLYKFVSYRSSSAKLSPFFVVYPFFGPQIFFTISSLLLPFYKVGIKVFFFSLVIL